MTRFNPFWYLIRACLTMFPQTFPWIPVRKYQYLSTLKFEIWHFTDGNMVVLICITFIDDFYLWEHLWKHVRKHVDKSCHALSICGRGCCLMCILFLHQNKVSIYTSVIVNYLSGPKMHLFFQVSRGLFIGRKCENPWKQIVAFQFFCSNYVKSCCQNL